MPGGARGLPAAQACRRTVCSLFRAVPVRMDIYAFVVCDVRGWRGVPFPVGLRRVAWPLLEVFLDVYIGRLGGLVRSSIL